MSHTIQVRVDDELKKQADELFKDLGMDTTSAIRIFLRHAIMNNGFPFEIKRAVSAGVKSNETKAEPEKISANIEKNREEEIKETEIKDDTAVKSEQASKNADILRPFEDDELKLKLERAENAFADGDYVDLDAFTKDMRGKYGI